MELHDFEQAAKKRIRFEAKDILLQVEDLFNLPLSHQTKIDLDDVARATHYQLQRTEKESFVKERSGKRSLAELKMRIVKRVIELRLEDVKAKEAKLENEQRKNRIREIIREKEDDGLKEKSLDELKAELGNGA